MKLKALVAIVVIATTITPSQAAIKKVPVKSISVIAAKPILTTTLSGAAGDQILGLATTPNSIVITGVMESQTVFGRSDGFITSLDAKGKVSWTLHLGGPLDDLASGATRDAAGNFWVVGASPQVSAAPTTNTASALNPDGVIADTVPVSDSTPRVFTVWKVSADGKLLSTYSYPMNMGVYPRTIAVSGSGFIAGGDLADGTSFTLSISSLGEFSNLATFTSKRINPVAITVIPAGTATFKSFISSTTIVGIPSWKPKSAIPVVLQYAKVPTLRAAYSLKGTVNTLLYQSGLGLVVVADQASAYAIYLFPVL